MKLLTVALSLLLVSCGQSDDVEFDKFNARVVIEEDSTLDVLGRQQTVGGVCFIKLKKYPMCLQHEIRHCIEGNFHAGRKSNEDCSNEL